MIFQQAAGASRFFSKQPNFTSTFKVVTLIFDEPPQLSRIQ